MEDRATTLSGSTADVFGDPQEPMREQTECNLVLRLRWAVGAGHSHPAHTFLCVQDPEMAITAAARASEVSPHGLRLVGADVSPTGGRDGMWESLDLSGGWISGPCA